MEAFLNMGEKKKDCEHICRHSREKLSSLGKWKKNSLPKWNIYYEMLLNIKLISYENIKFIPFLLCNVSLFLSALERDFLLHHHFVS